MSVTPYYATSSTASDYIYYDMIFTNLQSESSPDNSQLLRFLKLVKFH